MLLNIFTPKKYGVCSILGTDSSEKIYIEYYTEDRKIAGGVYEVAVGKDLVSGINIIGVPFKYVSNDIKKVVEDGLIKKEGVLAVYSIQEKKIKEIKSYLYSLNRTDITRHREEIEQLKDQYRDALDYYKYSNCSEFQDKMEVFGLKSRIRGFYRTRKKN